MAQTIPGYRTLEAIGEGGMGRVVRGQHLATGRFVAIKFLQASLAREADALARFAREARIIKELRHPALVQLLEWGEVDGEPFTVCELVEGENLGELYVRDAPLPLARTLEIGRQIAEAIGFLHKQGIVHRDLKPTNVMIRPDGDVCLLDFGIAKHFGDARKTIEQVTREGEIVGTGPYMAPDSFGEPSPPGDIWALGTILYELLTGQRPYANAEVKGFIGYVEAARGGAYAPVSTVRADVPTTVDVLFSKFLHPLAAERFPDGEAAACAVQMVEAGSAPASETKLPATRSVARPCHPASGTTDPRPATGAVRASGRIPQPAVVQARKATSGPTAVAQPSGKVQASRQSGRVVLPTASAGDPIAHRFGLAFLAVGTALLAIFFVLVARSKLSPAKPIVTATATPAVLAPEASMPSVHEDAAALAKLLAKERHNLDDAWLSRFARARRSLLETHPVAAAEELRAHLDRVGLGKALDRFLPRAGEFFTSAAIPEVERRAVRSALCDLELLEYFADEHKLPWNVVSPAGSIARCVDSWDPVVELTGLPLREARSWIQWAVTPIRIGDIGRPIATEWRGLPEPHSGSWVLWYSLEDWRPGLILDVRVSRRMRRLLRVPDDRKAAPLTVLAARYNGPHGIKENTQVEMFKSASTSSVLSYAALRVPESLIEPMTRVELRVIDLPLSRTRSRDPKVIDRVLSLVPPKS